MKKVLLSAVALLVAVSAGAQKKAYGKFDLEIGGEISVHTVSTGHPGQTHTPVGYIEGRWQFDAVPVDLGLSMGLSMFKRKSGDLIDGVYKFSPVMAVADWQFGRGRMINPYVGLGMGITEDKDAADWPSPVWYFAIAPRAGVRFFRCANLSVGWLVADVEYSRFYANLGLYF